MKKRLLAYLFFAIIFSTSYAQNNNIKGVKVEKSNSLETGKTLAVVIGISDYRYIDDLSYAHKDAQVFYNYLISKIDAIIARMEESSIDFVDMLIRYKKKQ